MSDPSDEKRVYTRIARRDDDPVFTVAMAAAFFDLTADSFRRKEKLGYYIDSKGDPLVARRTPGGDRRYSLDDILRIAHSLRRLNKMTDRQLRLIVIRVDAFKEPIKKHRKRYRKGGVQWTVPRENNIYGKSWNREDNGITGSKEDS